MNEISIIIDGVRYDAVEQKAKYIACVDCDLTKLCVLDTAKYCVDKNLIFKKSTKSFER